MSKRKDRQRSKKNAGRNNLNQSSLTTEGRAQQVEERTSNDSSSIIRHGAGCLETFELRESELEKLESYTWGGRFFDTGIGCVTIVFTIVTCLAVSNQMKEEYEAIFKLVLFLCCIGSVVCFYLAYRRGQERKELFKKIRERV